MSARGQWTRLVAVAGAYGAAFVLIQRAAPFSLDSPRFVFVAMVCFLGLAFVARPVIPLRVPRMLKPVRRWEVDGGLYRRLGVPAFGALLRRTPLKLLNRDVYLRAGARGTRALGPDLEAAEASHFWDALLALPYLLRVAILGEWGALFWISLAQVLLNAYPIMHLRLTRHRLDRIASRVLPGRAPGMAASRRARRRTR